MPRVTIIGAGIIGLCSAYFARQKGFDVWVIDRDPEGSPSCSTGNAGMIVPSHFVPLSAPGVVSMGVKMMFKAKAPFAFKFPPTLDQILWSWMFMGKADQEHVDKCETILRDMNLESRKLYEAMTEDLGIGFQLVKRGLLMLCKTMKTLDAEAKLAKRANEIGVHASVHNPSELQVIDPTVTMDVMGGVHFHDDCHLTPHEFLAALRAKLRTMGVHFDLGRAGVTNLVPRQGKVEVTTARGEKFDSDFVVVACGVWSKAIARQLGVGMPMMAGKGYSMTLANPIETPTVCSLLMEARVAVTPMQNGVRFGGTMELGEPDEFVNMDKVKGIAESIPGYFPKFQTSDFEDQPIWYGFRPCSPDGLPYIGKMNHNPRVVMASGHSMMGLSLGPITGKLVAEILAEEDTCLPINQLNPNRYA
jgi:D-amino-acid dehydrogenase